MKLRQPTTTIMLLAAILPQIVFGASGSTAGHWANASRVPPTLPGVYACKDVTRHDIQTITLNADGSYLNEEIGIGSYKKRFDYTFGGTYRLIHGEVYLYLADQVFVYEWHANKLFPKGAKFTDPSVTYYKLSSKSEAK